MMRAGMDVARLNTSHGEIDEHMRILELVREVAASERRPVAVLVDRGGPKLRTGPTPGGYPVPLETGATVYLATATTDRPGRVITVDYPRLLQDVLPGDRVLIADGAIELEVAAREDSALRCRVRQGGPLGPRSGVHFPGSTLGTTAITDRDRVAIAAGVKAGADFFAISFVRGAEDVAEARSIVASHGADIPIIAKIERRRAVERLDEIVAEADGVMVARGDLGVEMPPEEVPVQQRRIIAAARNMIPVITATQMLESMIDSPRPTRAEASDVANAVWDYSDAVMLSGETAVGRFPVESVAMMDRIIRAAEAESPPSSLAAPASRADDHSLVVAVAARRIVESDPNIRAVVCFTNSGYTAFLISKVHPNAPVFAVTPSESVARRLTLARGVVPLTGPVVNTSEEMLAMVDRVLLEGGHVPAGEEVVVIASLPVARAGTTNFLKLHHVGEAASS